MFTDLLATFTLPLQLYCTTPIFVLRYQHIWDSLLVKNYVLWIKFAEKKIQIHGLFTPESHAMLMTTVWGPDSGLSHRDINNPRILVWDWIMLVVCAIEAIVPAPDVSILFWIACHPRLVYVMMVIWYSRRTFWNDRIIGLDASVNNCTRNILYTQYLTENEISKTLCYM